MVEVDSEVDPVESLLDICVVEDDVWRLAAQLKRHLLQVGHSSRLHDLATDDGGAGKGNLVDVHVGRKGGTSSLAEARNDVHDSRWETCLPDELCCYES